MGFFDKIFQPKSKPQVEKNTVIVTTSENNPLYQNNFDINKIPKDIFSLLWFGDGPYKNYDDKESNYSTNYGFFSFTIKFNDEPSLISIELPVKEDKIQNGNNSIGYFPSYQKLSPSQRYIYLNWLSDITQIVDIGYVFIFYYGLERHLIYGDYLNAIRIIKKLRECHQNASFQGYSRTALIMASIIKKDKTLLESILNSLKPDELDDNVLLIAKYLLKVDLTPDEIMSFSSKVGFTNKNYIKKYPQIFKDVLTDELFNAFNTNSFPFYGLQMKISNEKSIIFANYSFDMEVRCPELPNLMENEELKNSLYTLLLNSHNKVKEKLSESRKKGVTISPIDIPYKKAEIIDYISDLCPYCNTKLSKLPIKKKKCDFCQKNIFVRTQPLDKKKILLREDQIEEFEKERENYYRNKAANKIIAEFKERYPSEFTVFNNNSDSQVVDETEKETVLRIMINEGNEHFSNLNMGLYRNSILKKGEFLSETQDYLDALQHYLVVCYIDLNGPNNSGSCKKYPDLLREYPPFDPTNEKDTRMAPGVIAYINNIATKFSLSSDEIYKNYQDAQSIIANKNFPLDYLGNWDKIQMVINEGDINE